MKAIWQNENGGIYTGLMIHGQLVPMREFKTFAEFMEYVPEQIAESIMYLEFIERVLNEDKPVLSNKIESFLNEVLK